MDSEELSDWGIEFVREVDRKVVEAPVNEVILEAWKEGDFDTCCEWIKQTWPELTEDQLEWLEDFLSEL
jgi:hypothetical protein